MTIQDVTLVVPTRGPAEATEKFLRTLDHPLERVTLVYDEGRLESSVPDMASPCRLVSAPVKRKGFCEIQELGFVDCPTSHFIGLAIDLAVAPGTIGKAVDCYNAQIGNRDGIVKLRHHSNSHDDQVACFILIAKQFYLDHCWPTPYLYFWIDQEWTDIAQSLGCYAVADNIPIVHPSSSHHGSEWEQDRQLYEKRKQERKTQSHEKRTDWNSALNSA